MDELEDFVRQMEGRIVVAVYFSSKAREWGQEPDSRSKRVMEMISRLDLVIPNTGMTLTFKREGCRETTIDFTVSTEGLVSLVHNWHVITDYTGSDHQNIYCGLGDSRRAERRRIPSSRHTGNTGKGPLETPLMGCAMQP